jgi:hypothetical protein
MCLAHPFLWYFREKYGATRPPITTQGDKENFFENDVYDFMFLKDHNNTTNSNREEDMKKKAKVSR